MDASAKQQIIDRVKSANNILVTVSNNPSVDQLAACIGLTLMLNNMDKHATAVFSGRVPSTLEFLQPEKTIETNTDSLRDFIISLDKNKADKLKYKVEDQVVRIYITPYKTSLSENDLVFSQGDFNVEVVIALGIVDKTHIDAAITSHGKILHDATVITMNAGQAKVQPLGQINWQDPTASSLSEMIVSISEAFGTGLIDNQMATAFLTGIVAETNRFSNNRTTPKVMTMSAQLMAAGANQQLIVSKLEPPVPPVKPYVPGQAPQKPKYEGKPEATPDDGTLKVHKGSGKATEVDLQPEQILIDSQGNLKTASELVPLPPPPPSPTPQPTTQVPPAPSYMTPPAVGKTVEPPQVVVPEPEPGPHSLLNPDKQSSYTEGAFTANTQPEWAETDARTAFDPLSQTSPEHQQLPAQTPAAPVNVDSARNAVANALSGAVPPVPSKDVFTMPSIQNSEPPPAIETPAPPFPPPLTPVNSAVIPPNISNNQ